MANNQKKKGFKRFVNPLIVIVSIAGMFFLVYMLEQTFGHGGGGQMSVGPKQGTGQIGGQGGAAVKPNPSATLVKSTPTSTPTPTSAPTPTPTPSTQPNGLPRLIGFNPEMDLTRISVWWGERTDFGKSSKDAYLRTAFLTLCELLEEVEFVPPEDETPMNIRLDYDEDKTQDITVYSGNIATFPEMPERYFQVPNIRVVGYGLLPSSELPDTERERVETSAMLGYFALNYIYVELEQDTIKKVAASFYEMNKEMITKPEGTLTRNTALVFYNASKKYYINCYDDVLEYYGEGIPRTWFSTSNAEIEAMLSPLRRAP